MFSPLSKVHGEICFLIVDHIYWRSHQIGEGCCKEHQLLPIHGPFPRMLVNSLLLLQCISHCIQYWWESLKGSLISLAFLPIVQVLDNVTTVVESPQADVWGNTVH